MKKSFYFALALTAGLFASCSSDDLTADAPQQPGFEVNDKEAVQIKIGVDDPSGTTRGTGSVGNNAEKSWQGQKFNLFMFKKGTFIPAAYTNDQNQNVEIYNDTLMTTVRGENVAKHMINGVEQFNYFPGSTEPYSFWAYRLDDAWTDATGKAGWEEGADPTTKVINGVAVYDAGGTTYTWDTETAPTAEEMAAATATEWTAAPTNATEGTADTWYKWTVGETTSYAKCTAVNAGEGGYTDTDATEVTIPFKINGSQDIMIAETNEADAATDLIAADPNKTNAENAASRIYTAYAARRGVYPNLSFKHQLARLYFEIKAHTRDVSEKADKKTEDPQEYKGFKITGISVWSKDKGTLVAAYKNDAPAARITWDAEQDWADAGTAAAPKDADDITKLTELKIMQRASKIEKADFKMVEVVGAGTQVVGIPEGYYEGENHFNRTADTKFYDSNKLNEETGMPEGNELTNAQATAKGDDIVYYAAKKNGKHTDGTTDYDQYIEITDDSLNLVPLKAVTLKWGDDYVPASEGELAWRKMEASDVTTTYTWTKQEAAPDPLPEVAAKDVRPVTTTEGAVDAYYLYEKGGLTEWWKCTAITHNTDDAPTTYGTLAALQADDEADKTKIYKVGDDYYWWKSDAAPATEGTTVATPIGESLLIAPCDYEGGLKVRIYYERCKKLTGAKIQKLPGFADIYVKAKEKEGVKAFQANHKYKITAIMYSDGEAKTGNVTLEDEKDGETEDEEYDL